MIYRLACLVATSQSTEHARQRNRDWSISIPRNLAPFRHAGPFFHPRASGWMLRVSRFPILGKQMEKVIPATPGVLTKWIWSGRKLPGAKPALVKLLA